MWNNCKWIKSSSSRSTPHYIENKITNLFNIAINNNYDAIVLGAWGCGAFSETEDDADIISKHFKTCCDKFIYKYLYIIKDRIKIVFAIPTTKNYKIFKANL